MARTRLIMIARREAPRRNSKSPPPRSSRRFARRVAQLKRSGAPSRRPPRFATARLTPFGLRAVTRAGQFCATGRRRQLSSAQDIRLCADKIRRRDTFCVRTWWVDGDNIVSAHDRDGCQSISINNRVRAQICERYIAPSPLECSKYSPHGRLHHVRTIFCLRLGSIQTGINHAWTRTNEASRVTIQVSECHVCAGTDLVAM